MTTETYPTPSFRSLTRQEKTCIRQDVKRFEKIARDHGCSTLEDYLEFVADRLRWDPDGFRTVKSTELIRGLVAYFGNELLYATGFQRITADYLEDSSSARRHELFAQVYPGWLLVDLDTSQLVIVPWIILERLTSSEPDPASLDDVFDEIIGWNQGYLVSEDVQTFWIAGPDVGLADYLAA